MNKRSKKIQKRNAKKKAAKKQINQAIESERLAMKEMKRYQAMLTKSAILDILINDLDESPEDCQLYFETMESELDINFDEVTTKPAALKIEMLEDDGMKYKTTPWYEVFIDKMAEKYGEETAREKAWGIATGVMTCMMSANEIVKGEPILPM
jgi:molybdopterin-biosynthesis enzyme MoeA-like protein